MEVYHKIGPIGFLLCELSTKSYKTIVFVSKKSLVKTLLFYILIFCPWVIYASSLRLDIFGDITTSYFTGKEEYYGNVGTGINKVVSDLIFQNTELNLQLDLSKTHKKLNLSITDRIYGDLLSNRNTRTRFSSFNNFLD